MGTFRAQYSKCHPRHFFISRSSVGKIRQGIREGKGTAILIKVLFCSLGVLFFLFYVLRLFLRVGTPRAQYSKCHPRHFFILGSSLVFYTRLKGKVQGTGILRNSTFCASAGGVAFKRRGDGSVATVVARMASGKKVRIYKNSRTVGAAILHILARERVPFRLLLIPRVR